MQKLQLPFAAGDVVSARGVRWVVEEATPFADCVLLRLAGLAGLPGLAGAESSHRRHARLLHPFDRFAASPLTSRIRAVTRRQWARHLQSQVAECRTYGQLRSVRSAAVEVLSFQLEPVLALIRGCASRFLLADAVGLGKTIQAGLMLAELQQRGWCERALILTPAGLRQQWADELRCRFDIRAAIFDASALRASAGTLPIGVNPWSIEAVAIASIDFVKQPEVLQAAKSTLWDILVVDEAHQVAGAPLRSAAVHTLAGRARHFVLLTATPHAGDEAVYRSLCALGQIDRDDPILLFRRTREHTAPTRTRRVHLLPVRLSPDELEMHRLLDVYVRRLWHVARHQDKAERQLVAMVLSKRAYSSAASLAVSIKRRLASLSGQPPPPAQSRFTFDDEEAPDDAEPPLLAAAFERPDEEEAALRQILAAAERACVSERKVCALGRLLERVREPVIVFTEYRDTLATLERAVAGFRKPALLHGGLTMSERRAAVEAFTGGAADLLLATDAGSEGLNLQSRCRMVVNLELPWNPIRLEQRIGRVDRLGQSRTVHATHLFAEETAESTVLANLVRRLQRIRCSEIEMAACVINGVEATGNEPEPAAESCTITVELGREAESEAARLRAAKASEIGRPRRPDALHTGVRVIPVTALGSRGHEFDGASAICFLRAPIVNGAGKLVEELLVPVAISSKRTAGRRRRDVRAYAERLVEQIGPAVTALAKRRAEHRAAAIAAETRAWVARPLLREQHLSSLIRLAESSLVQAGLFDARSLKHREETGRRRQAALEDVRTRADALESVAALAMEPEVTLLLIRC
ncbi:MAG: hypothetical protein EXQ48_03430 [Acidobacteria bacterium]|nr:hypothetical protein [Acidobacteriota bacterium]